MNRISEREQLAASESASDRSDQRIVKMSPDGRVPSSIEVALRRHIDELSQAIRDKNVERLMSFYALDVVAFDLRPPLDTRGADAYRKNFQRWFASFESPIGFEVRDLHISPGEGAAFCHYLSHITGTRPSERKMDYWVRGTTCFEQRDDQWLVTHEHISMPTLM
jgi:ketosteroid isomerase-like protein